MMQELAEKINAATAAKELKKAWFVEQQRIKRALAPSLWRSLVSLLETGCDDLRKNTGLNIKFESINNLKVNIRNAGTGVLISLRYDADTPCVWFTNMHGANGYLAFRVNQEDGNTILFLDPKRDVALFVDEVANDFLSRLVQK